MCGPLGGGKHLGKGSWGASWAFHEDNRIWHLSLALDFIQLVWGLGIPGLGSRNPKKTSATSPGIGQRGVEIGQCEGPAWLGRALVACMVHVLGVELPVPAALASPSLLAPMPSAGLRLVARHNPLHATCAFSIGGASC
jgi:hypothetical protein